MGYRRVYTRSQRMSVRTHGSRCYVNWWSVGIAVLQGEDTLYESHPGKNVRVLEGLQQGTAMSSMTSQSDSSHEPETEPEPTAGSDLNVAQMIESNQSKWERNKYSIYADMALGALFFLVGKFTEDLALAAIIGAAAGLCLLYTSPSPRDGLLSRMPSSA